MKTPARSARHFRPIALRAVVTTLLAAHVGGCALWYDDRADKQRKKELQKELAAERAATAQERSRHADMDQTRAGIESDVAANEQQLQGMQADLMRIPEDRRAAVEQRLRDLQDRQRQEQNNHDGDAAQRARITQTQAEIADLKNTIDTLKSMH